MQRTKKFYLSIILSLIALFLISCDNKDKTGAEEVKKEERTLYYYAGNWWGKVQGEASERNIFTINTNGSFSLKGDATGSDDLIIPSSLVTRVSDTSYIASYHDSTANKNTKFTFNFSSDTQGKFTMEQEGVSPATLDITKK